VYYSAGVASLAAFGAAQALSADGPLWLAARVLLDGAGGLFGTYMMVVAGLSAAGYIMRAGRGGAHARPARGGTSVAARR
jgi:hypothetical protein